MERDGMLRHLAFFEELGRMDETDGSWRSVSAGLVVMRLVDQWIADGPVVSRVDSWGVSAVREAIAQIAETTPIKRILTSVVDVMTSSTAVDLHALCPRLMAYGQALEYEAKWSLAADVYATIVAHAHPVEDSDLAIAAHLQLGFCFRMLDELGAAGVAYHAAGELANSSDDLIGVLRAQIGQAKIAIARGNLPDADTLVTQTLGCAEEHALTEIRWRALNERAFIAGLRGRHEDVVRYGYESLTIAPDQRNRDRSLTNIATAFRHLGLLDVAREAYLVLAATAQEQFVRWSAGLNLMELAAFEGSELQFDKFRRDFESADFTPFLRVTYLLHVGRGYVALRQPETGVPYLQQAVDVASRYQLNQLMFEAEAALADLSKHASPVRHEERAQEIGDGLQGVIDAIHELKVLANV